MSKVLVSQISITESLIPSAKLNDPGRVKTAYNAYTPLTAVLLSGKEIAIFPVTLLNVAVKKVRLEPSASEIAMVGLPHTAIDGPK